MRVLGIINELSAELERAINDYLQYKLIPYKIIIILLFLIILVFFIINLRKNNLLKKEIENLHEKLEQNKKSYHSLSAKIHRVESETTKNRNDILEILKKKE